MPQDDTAKPIDANYAWLTEETLARLDKAGPRYTSYPTAVMFHDGVDANAYEARLKAANAYPEDVLSLYAHLPFCEHRCLFCGCHVVITRHRDIAARYLGALKAEIDLVAARLPDRRKVAQLHWGGGTPTYFNPDQLRALYSHFKTHFTFTADAEVAIEVNPQVTSHEQLETLAEIGFNRLSMGVQDFTPEVQRAIEREQSYEETAALVDKARTLGFETGLNVDLIYGLPHQNLETFNANLDQVLTLRPDRVATYSFAYVPWIKGHQRKLDTAILPDARTKLMLYLLARDRFLEAGYLPIGMDHFALPTDELARAAQAGILHRNFMGYTVKPATDCIAFGISAIGDLQGAFVQNVKKLSEYYAALEQGKLPVERGYELTDDDRLRRHVISQLMCNFAVDKQEVNARFSIDFDSYFAAALAELADLHTEGIIELAANAITVTARGYLFVRNVCMAFDRYLNDPTTGGKQVYSRTV